MRVINLLSWVQSGKTLEGEKNTHEKEDVLKTLEDRDHRTNLSTRKDVEADKSAWAARTRRSK